MDVEVSCSVGFSHLPRVDAVESVPLHHLPRKVEEDGAEAVAQVAVLPAPPMGLLKIVLHSPNGVELIIRKGIHP